MIGLKNKSWKPEILEQIMHAAANGEAEGLAELTLKIVALAAGLGMPKPLGLSFDKGVETKLEWASKNGRHLSLWLQRDGKIRFQSSAEHEGELIDDAPVGFVTHIFHAWTAGGCP